MTHPAYEEPPLTAHIAGRVDTAVISGRSYQGCPSPQAGQLTLAVTAAVKALPQPHTYSAASSG
jgi:hypothetical protein